MVSPRQKSIMVKVCSLNHTSSGWLSIRCSYMSSNLFSYKMKIILLMPDSEITSKIKLLNVKHLIMCLAHIQFSSVQLLSRVQLFVTPWTIAYQAPPSMGFSRQVYWNGLPFPSPEDLPDPGI